MLTDINFQEGEIQDFIVEVPTGILNAPGDIVFEESGGQAFIMEVTLTGGNIFIMSE
jgi:hypothetical protein